MKENENVPKLRFKEFDRKWEKGPIGNCIELFSGYAFKGEEISENTSGVPLLRGINVTEGYIRHNTEIDRYFLGDTSNLARYRVQVGDMIIAMDGSKVGKNVALASLEDDGSLLVQRVARIRPKDGVDIRFIYQKIFSSAFRTYVDVVNTSSGIPHISAQQIKDFTIGFPSFLEQKKIATFLTVIDDKIKSLKKKKTLLDQYKKGITQKIFTQELRFKNDDGRDFPDWEERNGNLIFESISNKKHNSDLPILAITQEYGAIPRDLIDYTVTVTEKSVETYKVVEVGDFIISLRSFQGGIEYSNYKGICSPAYIILRPFLPIDDYFFKCYFKTEEYIKLLNKNIEGIRDGKMISYKQFSEIPLPYPSIKEQTKIAQFLSNIDDKINQTQNQIAKTETWKKGLLQQMFV
jgi:type I restriction enzyme S subunit